MSTAEFDDEAHLSDEADPEVDVDDLSDLDGDDDDADADADPVIAADLDIDDADVFEEEDDDDDDDDDDVDDDEEDEEDDDEDEDDPDEDDGEAEESLDVLLAREKVLDQDDLGRIADESRGLSVKPALVGAGEFTCRSCFLVKRRAQLSDEKRMLCFDCA